jgi:hypothetical protein
MSRKDYEAIARTLAAFSNLNSSAPISATVTEIAGALAVQFANDNPRFSPSRFLIASGVAVDSQEIAA